MNRGANRVPGNQVSCLSHPPQIPSVQLQQFMLTSTQAHREATAAFLLMKTTSACVWWELAAVLPCSSGTLRLLVTRFPKKSPLFTTGSETLLLLSLEVCRETDFTHITLHLAPTSPQTFVAFLLQHRERLQTPSAHTCYTSHCQLTLVSWTYGEIALPDTNPAPADYKSCSPLLINTTSLPQSCKIKLII